MGDSNDTPGVAVSTKIMVLAIVVLFLMMLFVVFLHLYAKWFLYRRQEEAAAASGGSRRRRRRRFDFAPGHAELSVSSGLRRGLDPSLLKSLPVVIFSSKDFSDGLECAVCLSDLVDGEKARLLPKCNHGFHLDCIDMWFQSHSTCPLCRNPVSSQSPATSELSLESILNSSIPENSPVGGSSTESLNFPTNVLFWGNETQVSTLGTCLEEDRQSPSSSQSSSSSSSSSSSAAAINNSPEGMLVIDIPRQMDDDEEPKSPVTTRLRSLKRLLSRERKVNPFSSSGVDPEQIGG